MVSVADKIGTGGVARSELLGEVLTWDMAATEVEYVKVLDALTAAGLPKEEAAHLRAQTAFARAVKELREGRTIDRVTKDKTTGLLTFQFTKKHLDDTGLQIDFEYEALCHLDTDTGEITCEESPEIEAHALVMFKHAMAHRNTSDVTRLVQNLFTSHADLYPINPRKGVAYFVPEAHRGFSEKVEAFLQALGGRLLRFPVPKGTPEGNRAVKASVEDGLHALAAELEEAVDGWNEKTRESTFEKAVEKWQQIRHKAEAYSEYLGDRQASLLTHLDAQKRRLAAKVSELTALKDAAAHGDDPAQRTMFPGASVPIDTGETAELATA